jgi:hypothetical protein
VAGTVAVSVVVPEPVSMGGGSFGGLSGGAVL